MKVKSRLWVRTGTDFLRANGGRVNSWSHPLTCPPPCLPKKDSIVSFVSKVMFKTSLKPDLLVSPSLASHVPSRKFTHAPGTQRWQSQAPDRPWKDRPTSVAARLTWTLLLTLSQIGSFPRKKAWHHFQRVSRRLEVYIAGLIPC